MLHTWKEKDVGKDFYSTETGRIYHINAVTETSVIATLISKKDATDTAEVGNTTRWPLHEMRWLHPLNQAKAFGCSQAYFF